MDKTDESGEPNDLVEKEHTETIENVIQPELHSVDELKNEANLNPSPSNNEMNDDIDINDIVLITESVPSIEGSVENNKTIDPNVTDKESEAKASNENVVIDKIELIDGTQNEMAPNVPPEKIEDEPIDIDEILNSLDAEFVAPSNSEAQKVCEASSQIVPEKQSDSTSAEKGKIEEIVLLSDDDDEADGRFGFELYFENLFPN